MPNPYVNGIQNGNETIDIYDAALRSTIGQSNGIATLDSNGKLTASQLPSDSNKLDTTTLALSGETEATTTATMAHAKDSKFYLAATGEYCMAKTAIAIGDTLVKDTNYQVISINGFLTDMEAYLILAGQMLDTKADKVSGATNGNLAGLNGSGNPTDSGWNGAKDTTSISGNPISISGLKSNQLAINPIITLEPIQDLHGQSNPYPAGGGKNLIPMTVDGIKAANIAGTWSGNVYTYNGLTFTILVDNANNVVGIRVNGTASASTSFMFTEYSTLSALGLSVGGSYLLNGGVSSTINLRLGVQGSGPEWTSISTNDTAVNITSESESKLYRYQYVISGQISNVTLTPMLRLATISDNTFAPYTNICPISGYDKIEVLSCGKNLFDGTYSSAGKFLQADGSEYAGTYNISQYISVKASTAYYFSNLSGTTTACICWYNKAKEFISSQSITVGFTATSPVNACYVRASVRNDKTDVCINEGNTAITYEPHHKTTDLSLALGQTVYGATWYPRTGKLHEIINGQDLGNLQWAYDSTYSRFVTNNLPNVLSQNTRTLEFYCSCYECIHDGRDMSDVPNYSIYTSGTNLYVHDSRYTDGTAFKTAVTGQKIAYPVATSTEIQLAPHEISLLKDYAYVSTNGTSISLDYHNGELASLADVAQLAETVENEKNIFPKRMFEQDIISYNSSTNRYQVPMDGYVTVSLPGSVTGYVRIIVYDSIGAQLAVFRQYTVSNSDQYYSLFIKKGMKIQVTASSDITSGVIFRGIV